MILTNVLSSPYFKVQLYELKTYHEVVDEIYFKVMLANANPHANLLDNQRAMNPALTLRTVLEPLKNKTCDNTDSFN